MSSGPSRESMRALQWSWSSALAPWATPFLPAGAALGQQWGAEPMAGGQLVPDDGSMLSLASPVPVVRRRLDAESRGWVEALSSEGAEREEAVERLHALLLRAARFEVARRGGGFRRGIPDREDLAMQAANDALMA